MNLFHLLSIALESKKITQYVHKIIRKSRCFQFSKSCNQSMSNREKKGFLA